MGGLSNQGVCPTGGGSVQLGGLYRGSAHQGSVFKRVCLGGLPPGGLSNWRVCIWGSASMGFAQPGGSTKLRGSA